MMAHFACRLDFGVDNYSLSLASGTGPGLLPIPLCSVVV